MVTHCNTARINTRDGWNQSSPQIGFNTLKPGSMPSVHFNQLKPKQWLRSHFSLNDFVMVETKYGETDEENILMKTISEQLLDNMFKAKRQIQQNQYPLISDEDLNI